MSKQKPKYEKAGFAGDKIRTDINRREKIWKIISNLTFLLLIVSGIGFVVSINSISIEGFVLLERKNALNKIITENEKIELKIAAFQSFENINKQAQDMKMVKADKIEYIIVTDSEIAKK